MGAKGKPRSAIRPTDASSRPVSGGKANYPKLPGLSDYEAPTVETPAFEQGFFPRALKPVYDQKTQVTRKAEAPRGRRSPMQSTRDGNGLSAASTQGSSGTDITPDSTSSSGDRKKDGNGSDSDGRTELEVATDGEPSRPAPAQLKPMPKPKPKRTRDCAPENIEPRRMKLKVLFRTGQSKRQYYSKQARERKKLLLECLEIKSNLCSRLIKEYEDKMDELIKQNTRLRQYIIGGPIGERSSVGRLNSSGPNLDNRERSLRPGYGLRHIILPFQKPHF